MMLASSSNGEASHNPAVEQEVVIKVENLSKRYLVGHQIAHHESFREAIVRHTGNFGRKAIDMVRGRQIVQGDMVEEFWALKDVSFEVRRGEVVGVIGRNGAGKSTLLKILSRITEPTKGRIRISGRVACLLEVGTGFHPELSGRENIFLSGAILGMTQREISAKLDEIVAFSGVERFLDTPVKRYSSGMYVRLAFAVAAHLEPEILIVDEVLAVGDFSFQKKCLGKMRDVAQHGRTVVFVSHSLTAVNDLTSRAILLEAGRVQTSGATREVVSVYLNALQKRSQGAENLSSYRRNDRTEGYVDITSAKVCGNNVGVASVGIGHPLSIDVGIAVHRVVDKGIIVIDILDEKLEVITALASFDADYEFAFEPGNYTIRCNIPSIPLIPGFYHLNVSVAEPHQRSSWDVLELIPGFHIEGDESLGWMKWPRRPGVVLLQKCEWSEL